jgi:hypothetical protein
MLTNDESLIVDTIRLAKEKRRTETLIIRIVDGVVIVMRGQVIIKPNHCDKQNVSTVDMRNGTR